VRPTLEVSAVRAACAVVLSIVLAGASLAWAVPAAAAPIPAGSQPASYTFAFHDADVAQVAQEILGAIGVRYSIDPGVTGRISLRIEQRLTKTQLLQAFETALAAQNIAVVPSGDTLVLTSKAKARASTGVRPAADGIRSAGYEVVAAPVSFAIPTEVAKALEAITGPGVVLHASDKLGLIVLGGNGSQLQSALESLKVFDQSGLEGSRIRWFELTQAPAAQVAAELDTLLTSAGIAGVRVAPLKRLNGVILFGNTSKVLDQVSPWVARLDTPTRDTAASLWVYHPRNTSAEALARTLNSVASSQTIVEQTGVTSSSRPRDAGGPAEARASTAATVTPAFADDAVRAAVDKDTNTLLISAPAWRWVQLQRILSEIDRPQAQVLIEATILEVTLQKEFRLGVDWSAVADAGRLHFDQNGNGQGTIGPQFPGFSVTYLGDNLQAAITALGSRTNVEVLSAPKLMTLDNREARLQVGDQVPVITQTSQSTQTPNAPVINSIEYRNSGVILSVTPRISGEDRVTVDVSQEVSSVVQTKTSGIDSPTIQQRRLQSTLVLNDGGVVALGGMISRSRNAGTSGIPGLKDIPGLGALFRSTTRDENRTELIVLLKVKIIRDAAGSTAALADLLADLREIKARGLLNGL
jgi:general secretion pathway protein D